MKIGPSHIFYKLFLTITLLLFPLFAYSQGDLPKPIPQQAGQANEIQIKSEWGGLGPSRSSAVAITRKDSSYYSEGRQIEKQKIDDLLSAINEPVLEAPTLDNMGITQQWLNDNAAKGIAGFAPFSFAAANQKELYYSAFKNPKVIEKLIPEIMRGGWTDDVPRIEITISLADGKTINLSSWEQPQFMLPWKIVKDGKTIETHNAHISKTLAAILPKNFTNRHRIAGDYFASRLAEEVMDSIKTEWDRLDAKNRASGAFDNLEGLNSVSESAVNSTHGVDFGTEVIKGKAGEKNLHIVFRDDRYPKSYSLKMITPFPADDTGNSGLIDAKVKQYEDLLLSVPWIKEVIAGSNTSIQLRFVKDRSFSPKAMRIFAADMALIGKSELVAEVEKEQENIALITDGSKFSPSFWLILPSKKVILWRYRNASLFKWAKSDFPAKKCSRYNSTSGGCVGAVISPEGEIISK